MPSGIYLHTSSWNKGLKMLPGYGEARRHSFAGKHHTQEAKDKVSVANKNHIVTKDMRNKMSKAAKLRIGDKATNWRGGITQATKRGRGNKQYKIWQLAVFERDNFQCVWCSSKDRLDYPAGYSRKQG